MSASEIRPALFYSIQKVAYIVTNTYQDVGTQPILHIAHDEYSASLTTLDRFFHPP